MTRNFKPCPNALAISVANSVDEAPNWSRDYPDVRAVDIKKAIIVKGGMDSGKSTVDFVIVDQDGNENVAMLTGELVKNLALMINVVER